MHKILVPCDGSDNSVRAVRYAGDLAKKIPGIELELLYVQDPVLMKQCGILPADEKKKLECADADRILQEARQVLKDEGVSWNEALRAAARPASEIARHAHESGCDAIVMGSRGLGPIASVMIGSVATHTVHLVHVPVTLVK